MVETFVDEYGEKRYRIPLTARVWKSEVLPALEAERYPNERAIDGVRDAIAGVTDDDETVTVTLASMEAMAVSRVLG